MDEWAAQLGGRQFKSRVYNDGLKRHLCQVEPELPASQLELLSKSEGKVR